ncbi:MAG: hypothetical protein AAFN80_05085 [Pseudomonadota bacterium]
MIVSIKDLSEFLQEWYNDDDLGLPVDQMAIPSYAARPLVDLWREIGRLTIPYEYDMPGPLATQNRLVSPGKLKHLGGLVPFAFENQNVWTWCHEFGAKADNPKVITEGPASTQNDQHIYLTEFLISFVLEETVFFSWDRYERHSDEKRRSMFNDCTENVISEDNHSIKTNAKRTLLLNDHGSEEGLYVGERALARERWSVIRAKSPQPKSAEAFGSIKALFGKLKF